MFKKIPYRITGITGIELGEHAHHMNPSGFYFPFCSCIFIIDSLLVLHIVMHAFYVLIYVTNCKLEKAS
jgi:hypothetical protein